MRTVLLTLIACLLLGCTGPGEKGGNKGKDIPKPAETGK